MIDPGILHIGQVVSQGGFISADAVNKYFTPMNYIFYLGALLVAMVVYYQWKWAKVCKKSVLVLIQKQDGHGDYELAPQAGGSVSLRNPDTDTVKMWPINELATLDVPYPGVGFVPGFMQKQIRMVIVPEGDWEPLLNRSPYREKVASPDVKELIMELADQLPGRRDELLSYAERLSPVHTREMIASPSVLGNLMHERITEVIITVNKEMLDRVAALMSKLSKIVSPTMFFIGIGVVLIGVIVVGVFVGKMSGSLSRLSEGQKIIQDALGIVTTVVPK